MLKSKLFLVILLIYVLCIVGYPTNSQSDAQVIPINHGANGPESFDFDPVDGTGPYTGVSDGRIIKWIATENRWTDFAVTSPHRKGCGDLEHEQICGRQLGLKFHKASGKLLIADATFGLLEVGPNGGLATSLVSKAEGFPLMFTNGLEIDQANGLVYFTDSSLRYSRRNVTSMISTHDQTGRLLKYDLKSRKVTVLLHNLTFANGVALSQDGKFLLVAETTNYRVLRLWLKTLKAGTLEVFADLPGDPDNIKRNQNGEFWVAMRSRKNSTSQEGEGLAVKLGVNGEILEMLEDVNGKIWKHASEIMEKDGYLWIGSADYPFVVKLKYDCKGKK